MCMQAWSMHCDIVQYLSFKLTELILWDRLYLEGHKGTQYNDRKARQKQNATMF